MDQAATLNKDHRQLEVHPGNCIYISGLLPKNLWRGGTIQWAYTEFLLFIPIHFPPKKMSIQFIFLVCPFIPPPTPHFLINGKSNNWLFTPYPSWPLFYTKLLSHKCFVQIQFLLLPSTMVPIKLIPPPKVFYSWTREARTWVIYSTYK